MEQLNRIEIRGNVGTVRLQTFSENRVARFTVATNYAYKDKTGAAVIETSWHNVIAREGRQLKDLDRLHKGSKVYVQGRLRYQKYQDDNGMDRYATDIMATSVVILDDEAVMQYEMQ